jgi:hypothetical protein
MLSATDTVTHGPTFNGLPIQARPCYGVRTGIIEVLQELFKQMEDQFGAFVVVMLSIRVPPGVVFADSNHAIKRLCSQFAEYLAQQGIEAQYVWVRLHPEYPSDPHYVAVLLAEACYVLDPGIHLAHANGLWAQCIESTQRDGLIRYCNLECAPLAVPVLKLPMDGQDFHGSYERSFRALSRLAHIEGSGDGSEDASAYGSSLPS